MKIRKSFLFICCVASICLFTALLSARVNPTYAIVNCKIFPVTGTPVENGVIIIRDGLIESLGPQGKVLIPEDAEVIKADGLFAYPGLIDAYTGFFLEPVAEEARGQERMTAAAAQPAVTDWAKQVETMAFGLLKPKKSDIENLHKVGITTVLVVPERRIFAGQSVLLNVNGEKTQPMVISNPVALHVNFTTERRGYPNSLMGTMAFLRQSFLDADYYSACKSQFSKSSKGMKRPEYAPFLEALLPYVVQKKQIFFNCANQEDIKRAIGLIEEFKLNGLLCGANEAWRVASLIKKAKIPVLVSLDFKPPFTSIYVNKGEELKEKAEKEIYPANASNLHQEGITFALTSFGLKNPADFSKNVQQAIKAGLPADQALKAMTVIPAQMLGVSDMIGSLEAGKAANIVLTSGEIFGEKTKVEKVFVDGLCFEIKQAPKEAKPSALNIGGKWKATVAAPTGEMQLTMEIQQEETRVSGSISSDLGKMEISDGLLSGNELTFIVTATIIGENVEMTFSGTAERDSIKGTISFIGGSAELRATRIPDGIF